MYDFISNMHTKPLPRFTTFWGTNSWGIMSTMPPLTSFSRFSFCYLSLLNCLGFCDLHFSFNKIKLFCFCSIDIFQILKSSKQKVRWLCPFEGTAVLLKTLSLMVGGPSCQGLVSLVSYHQLLLFLLGHKISLIFNCLSKLLFSFYLRVLFLLPQIIHMYWILQ